MTLSFIHESDSHPTHDGLCSRLRVIFSVTAEQIEVESIHDTDHDRPIEFAALPEQEKHSIRVRMERISVEYGLNEPEPEYDKERDL